MIFCIVFFSVLRVDGGVDGNLFFEIYNVLLGIVPGDFITPFVKGNTLQIVFMAFVSGVVILILDNEVHALKEIAIKLNRFFQFMLISICELMPLIIFLSFLHLVITNSIMLAADAWRVILAEAIITAGVILFYFWQVSRSTEESLLQIIKTFIPLSVLAITTSSSIARLKLAEELLLKRFHLPKSLVDFGLPMGLVLSKPGIAVHFFILVFGFSEMCGHEVSFA